MQIVGSSGQTVQAVGSPTKRVNATAVRMVGAAAGGPSTPSRNLVASVVLYCPTLTAENLLPTDGETMFWVEFTPDLDGPDPSTGLTDWTTREEFTWSPGWADNNDPTSVLILTADQTWRPTVFADVVPNGFEAVTVYGCQLVTVGCYGGAPEFAITVWAGWNFSDEIQGGAPDPTRPAEFIGPTGMTADQVRIIDKGGGGDHRSLADWIAELNPLRASDIDVPGGVAGLDGDGKLSTSVLPALAIGDTFPVGSEVAMLALDAQRGDVAIRADLTASFILSGDDPTVLADWLQLSYAGGIVSVNGQTGVVVLGASDVGAVPTARTVNGKALSSDITLTAADVSAATAAQGALADTAVQPGDLPDFDLFGAAPLVDELTVGTTAQFSIDVTGLRLVRVVLAGRGDAVASTIGVRARLNSDSATNYYLGTTGTPTNAWNNNGSFPGADTNTDRQGLWIAYIALGGVGRFTTAIIWSTLFGSTATAGSTITTNSLHYANTAAAITSLQLYPASNNFAAGTRLIVEGW